MRILVVGAGAVGSWVGGKLALMGHQVTLVGRQRYAEAVWRDGLRLSEEGWVTVVPGVRAATSVGQAVAQGDDFDLVIFTMKSYDTASSVEELRQALPDTSLVLSLQNGVGNEEVIAAAFGEERTIAGTVTVPVTMSTPGIVEARAGRRGIALASLQVGSNDFSRSVPQQRPESTAECQLTPLAVTTSIAQVFRYAGFNVSTPTDYRAMKWSKLLLNLIGNATSAILGWPPQRVFADPHLFRIEYRALHEALDVMAAMGLRPVALPGYPLHLIVPPLRLLPLPLLQRIMVKAVASGRGGKMPSLYLDLERGKAKSEVAFLNGAVAEHGRRLGVPAPVNEMLCKTLMRIVGEVSGVGRSEEAPGTSEEPEIRTLFDAMSRLILDGAVAHRTEHL